MPGLLVVLVKMLYMWAALTGGEPVEPATVEPDPVVIVDPDAEGQTDTPEVIQGETVETNSDFYFCQQFPSACENGRWVPTPGDAREVICAAMGPGVQSARSIADIDALIASGECVVV